jgi:hypothetical protein
MGITSGKKIGDLLSVVGSLFAILIPLFNGCVVAILSGFVSDEVGDRFIFAILAASASLHCVPAAMRMAIPKANPAFISQWLLQLRFRLISLGMPIYTFGATVMRLSGYSTFLVLSTKYYIFYFD